MGVQGTEELAKVTTTDNSSRYILEFLNSRRFRLMSMGDVFARTVTRINSYEFVLQNNPEWNNAIQALNNDGDVVTLHCESNFTLSAEFQAITTPDVPKTISTGIRESITWYLLLMYL
jgi:hypothetical protein